MRAFIAVEISEEARAAVARLQETLRTARADVKWVEPRNLHLTLKFLGEIQEENLPALTEALCQTAAVAQPFSISLEGVGAFPRIQNPRALWVGMKEGKEPLERLAGATEEACSSFLLRRAQHEHHPLALSSSKGERPFSPHLTIGRLRSGERLPALVKKLQETLFQSAAPASIDRLILFQSALSANGPTYMPLAKFPLGR